MTMARMYLELVSIMAILGLLLAGCAPAAAPPGDLKPGSSPAAPAATPKPAAEQPKYGGVLKHAALQDENTFDLHTTARNLAAEQAGPCYSGLLKVDEADGRRIVPDLAESYQFNPDGKKVTFALRKTARWSDGKPFTSADVKFNFDRWMKPPEGLTITRKEIVDGVDRVETPDDYTVDVYLKAPKPSFLSGISLIYAIMLPPQYLKDHKTMEYTILGTGPYKLKEYKRGVSVEFVKNEGYFVPGKPYLDGIIHYIIPESTARLAAFRTGQVRSMFAASNNITPSQAEALKKEMSDKVTVARIQGLSMGVLHENSTKPPFNDLKVRQAINMALDRKKMLDVLQGRAEITGPMLRGPWGLPDDELLKRPGYRSVTPADIDKAKSLLAEAGYSKGFEAEGMVADAWKNQMVFVQDQLKDIGITVNIKMVDTATMEKRYFAKDFALSFYQTSQPVDDPDIFMALYLTGAGRNYSGFSDKQIDDWYREQSMTMDNAKRREILLNMQRRILDLEGPPIMYMVLIDIPYWNCVKGWYPEKAVGYHNDVKREDVWLDTGCGS